MKLLMIILSVVTGLLLATVLSLALIGNSILSQNAKDISVLQHHNTVLTARVNGGHRDLITCGDLQTYIGSLPQYDNAGDWLGGGSTDGMATLPQHCINR